MKVGIPVNVSVSDEDSYLGT